MNLKRQRIIKIDSHHTYQLNSTDHCELRQYLDRLLSGQQRLIKRASINWNRYHYQDFRYKLGQEFEQIQRQLVSQFSGTHCYQSYKYYPANISFQQFSNIDLNQSKHIVKQIHNLIKSQKQLMKYQESSKKYEMNANHFMVFLERIEQIVRLIEYEQEQFKQFGKVNEMLSEKQLNKNLEKQLKRINEKSDDLRQLFSDMDIKMKSAGTNAYSKFRKDIELLQKCLVDSHEKIKCLNIQIQDLQQNQSDKKDQNTKLYTLFSPIQENNSVMGVNLKRKQQLLGLIEDKTGRSIEKSQFLYKHSKSNSDFQRCIFGKQNFLLIVQTSTNIFGVFSTSSFQENSSPDHPDTIAFIFVFEGTKLISYDFNINRTCPTKQSLVYSKNYLVIGNQDIRIEPQAQLVYSSLGLGYSCFEANDEAFRMLINSGDSRYAQLVSYECYQMEFTNDD